MYTMHIVTSVSYSFQNDIARKPQGFITLDSDMAINRNENSLTFELVTTKRTYYLTADSIEELDHWIRGKLKLYLQLHITSKYFRRFFVLCIYNIFSVEQIDVSNNYLCPKG